VAEGRSSTGIDEGPLALSPPPRPAQGCIMTTTITRAVVAAALLYRNWGTTKEECRATQALRCSRSLQAPRRR
jgi:hypothetical protein